MEKTMIKEKLGYYSTSLEDDCHFLKKVGPYKLFTTSEELVVCDSRTNYAYGILMISFTTRKEFDLEIKRITQILQAESTQCKQLSIL